MHLFKSIWAGSLIAVLFIAACNSSISDKTGKTKKPQPVQLENVVLDTLPFDCSKDTLLPLGFINKDWVYNNQRLGIRFEFPKGWNAIEDIANSNPNIVPVGGDLTDLRERYTHPQTLRLSLMKGNAWNEKRYLFGITKTPPKHVMDETPLDLESAPIATAEVFYGDEFSSEESLYKKVISNSIEAWETEENKLVWDLNKASIKNVKPVAMGGTTFYSHTIRLPQRGGVMSYHTLVKKLDCLFLVLTYVSGNEQEKKLMLESLKGLKINR